MQLRQRLDRRVDVLRKLRVEIHTGDTVLSENADHHGHRIDRDGNAPLL